MCMMDSSNFRGSLGTRGRERRLREERKTIALQTPINDPLKWSVLVTPIRFPKKRSLCFCCRRFRGINIISCGGCCQCIIRSLKRRK